MCIDLDLDPIDQPVWAGAARVRQRDEEASEVRCAAQTVYSYLA